MTMLNTVTGIVIITIAAIFVAGVFAAVSKHSGESSTSFSNHKLTQIDGENSTTAIHEVVSSSGALCIVAVNTFLKANIPQGATVGVACK